MLDQTWGNIDQVFPTLSILNEKLSYNNDYLCTVNGVCYVVDACKEIGEN